FLPRGGGRGRARRREPHAEGRRCGLRGGRERPWLLQHGDRTGPLDRDPGATAAGAPCLPLGTDLARLRRAAPGLSRPDVGRSQWTARRKVEVAGMADAGSVLVVGG